MLLGPTDFLHHSAASHVLQMFTCVKCHLLETADTAYRPIEEPQLTVSELTLLISLGKTP
jgi:hypothetical protein